MMETMHAIEGLNRSVCARRERSAWPVREAIACLILCGVTLAVSLPMAIADPGDAGGRTSDRPAHAESSLLLAQAGVASPAARPDVTSLVNAAKAEGEVTFYIDTAEAIGKRVVEAFSGKYGIKAQFVRLASQPMQQRYATEAEGGTFSADMLFAAGGRPFAEEGVKKGWFEPVASAGLPVLGSGEFPSRFVTGPVAIVQIAPWMIGYNTDRLKGGDIPKDWPDLLSPRFNGQILMPDPRASTAYIDLWALLLDRYGESFLVQIREKNPRRFSGGAPAVQALGAGEGTVLLPAVLPTVQGMRANGAPVATVTVDQTTGVEVVVVLTARTKARRPNAARLLANFALSPEGNQVFNNDPGGMTVYDTSRLPKRYESPKSGNAALKDKITGLLGFQ